MIVKLTIDMLGTSGKDKSTTEIVNAHLQASKEAGYYKKCKLDNESIKAITSARDAARKTHKELTTAFGDDHWRLLPATRVKEYTTEIRAHKQIFEDAVSDIEAMWPAIIAKQKKRLDSVKSNLFDPNDYPFVRAVDPAICPDGYAVDANIDLSSFYAFNFDMRATPDAGHVVIDLEAETIKEIKAQIEKQNEKNIENSKLELWHRLIEPVKNMANICTNDKKVFKSLTANIEKEIKILSDLNVTNDINLTNALKDVKQNLTGYTAGQIREDKALKSDLGNKATALTNQITASMTGSAPN